MTQIVKKHKQLGFWILTALVVGNMVGSGVFLLPASLASLGSIALFSWVVTGTGAMLIALVFARLSQMFPKTGGPYIYCKEGFGEFIGFQVAYNYWVYMWVGNAAIALAFTGYLSTFFPQLLDSKLASFSTTVGVVWFFSLVNIIGVRFAGFFQVILTIFKFVPLALIAFVGVFFISWDNLKEFNLSGSSNFTALSGGAVLTLWAFLGLESASIPADEVKNPQKMIPRATLVGTSITAIVYILATLAIMGLIPASTLQRSSAPFSDYAFALGGFWGKIFMGFIAATSCAGALNGWILLQGQIPLAAAKDKLFPKPFGNLSARRTPTFGIVVSSILVTCLLTFNYSDELVSQFTFIISLATLAAIIAYLYTTMAGFMLFLKDPTSVSKKKMVLASIALLAFIYAFLAIVSAGDKIVYYGSILMFTSLPIYAWVKYKNE